MYIKDRTNGNIRGKDQERKQRTEDRDKKIEIGVEIRYGTQENEKTSAKGIAQEKRQKSGACNHAGMMRVQNIKDIYKRLKDKRCRYVELQSQKVQHACSKDRYDDKRRYDDRYIGMQNFNVCLCNQIKII